MRAWYRPGSSGGEPPPGWFGPGTPPEPAGAGSWDCACGGGPLERILLRTRPMLGTSAVLLLVES